MTDHAPSICVVTRIRGDAGSAERTRLIERLAAAAGAGADVIQIRERLLSDRELAVFTAALVDQVSGTGCRVLVNDRTDVALAAGAHGVHLKSGGPSATDVRRLAPPGFIVGRSLHSTAEAVALSREGGYDYLLFGTVFPSQSKPEGHPAAGLDALRAACAAATVPVVAIGGLNVERARSAIEAGAAGIAAIGLFAGGTDVVSLLAELRAAMTVRESSN